MTYVWAVTDALVCGVCRYDFNARDSLSATLSKEQIAFISDTGARGHQATGAAHAPLS